MCIIIELSHHLFQFNPGMKVSSFFSSCHVLPRFCLEFSLFLHQFSSIVTVNCTVPNHSITGHGSQNSNCWLHTMNKQRKSISGVTATAGTSARRVDCSPYHRYMELLTPSITDMRSGRLSVLQIRGVDNLRNTNVTHNSYWCTYVLYGPAPYVMFWMCADPLRGQVREGVGRWKSRLFWASSR